MTFAQKGSIAIAVLILGWVLDAIGYQANQVMSASTVDNMKIIMTLIPILGISCSLIIIYFYPIDSKMHKDLLRQLQKEAI